MTHKYIVTDPTIASGAPIIYGTSVTVDEVLGCVAATIPAEVTDQLGLELADVKAALEYAATVVHQQAKLADEEQSLGNEVASDQETVELDLKKILAVDDDKNNLFLIQHMFKDSGFTISTASNAEEALIKARTELPVLIISDVQMPGMDGFELLTTLKTDERTKNIAVILVTAHHRGSKRVSQGLVMGADDYIYRPFLRNEFMSRVGAVIRVKWAEAETRRQARVVARRNKGLKLVNELALAVNSSLDLQEIFASAMQKLSQLLDVDAVSLLLLNDEQQNWICVDISSRTGERVSASLGFRPEEEITDGMLQEQVPILVSNILNDRYGDLGLDSPYDADTIQCIPMLSKEQIIGAIAIVNRDESSFDDADWVLLHSAAGIIAVAVENAHLLANAQQQVDDLIALNEIGRALTSTLDLNQILKQTTLLVQRALQAEATSLWLLDEPTQELVLIAASGVATDVVTGFRLSIDDGIAGYVARTGESYISVDVSDDEYFYEHVANLSNYKPRSMLCVPVQVKDQVIGVLQALHQNVNWFNQSHLRLSYPVANFVSIAIENARLFNEVQEFSQHLEQMVAERTRELAEEKEKTEAILASMADGLLVLDAKNRILTANTVAEDMLDFRLSELWGRPIEPEQLENPLWRCISDMVSSAKLTVNVSVDVPTAKNGSVLSIQAHSAKVRNEAGQVIGTVIVLSDITALKEVERMKARFMAGVTHELKTPLSIIRLHSKNLLTYYDRLPDQKRNELLNSIQGQVKLLEKLVSSILELSRLDAGMIEIKRQPLNLVELIDQVVADLRSLAEAKPVALHWQKPGTDVGIQADSDQLERVIRNLIDNAIKYTPASGSIEIQTFSELVDGQVIVGIRVADTGIGIPSEDQARVFDRFYRVDPSHTLPGTGLGLSIVKEIVNAHGGDVQLESTPGVGSTFVVTLPGMTS